jgi:hypothetical protein
MPLVVFARNVLLAFPAASAVTVAGTDRKPAVGSARVKTTTAPAAGAVVDVLIILRVITEESTPFATTQSLLPDIVVVSGPPGGVMTITGRLRSAATTPTRSSNPIIVMILAFARIINTLEIIVVSLNI